MSLPFLIDQDIKKLTIKKLKDLFDEVGVKYPPNMLKDGYIKIYQDNMKPAAKKAPAKRIASPKQMVKKVDKPVSPKQMAKKVDKPASPKQMAKKVDKPVSPKQMVKKVDKPVSPKKEPIVKKAPIVKKPAAKKVASPKKLPVKKDITSSERRDIEKKLRDIIDNGEDTTGKFDELIFTHNIPLARFIPMIKKGPLGLLHTNRGAQFRYGIDSQYGEIMFIMKKDFLNSFEDFLECDGFFGCKPVQKPFFWNPLVDYPNPDLEATAKKFTFRPEDYRGNGTECQHGVGKHYPTWCNQQVHINKTVSLDFVDKVLIPSYIYDDGRVNKKIIKHTQYDMRNLNTDDILPNGEKNPLKGKVLTYGPSYGVEHYSYISPKEYSILEFYGTILPMTVFKPQKTSTIREGPISAQVFISPEAFYEAEQTYMHHLVDEKLYVIE
jgi:hypothetical protein